MSVTAKTLRLQDELADQLTRVTDRQSRTLVAAWVDAWDEIAPDLTATLLEMLVAGDNVTRAQLLRSTRLRRALALVADQLETLAKDAGVLITGDLRGVIDTAGSAQASVIDSQLPPNFMTPEDVSSWSRVDERQITAIVERSTQQITSLTRPLSAEAYDAVRRELIRGVAAGTSPRDTARRIVARAEGRFNGGLTRALTIARTETIDAHRAAAQLGQEAHADVLAGWTWLASLSARTCAACIAMHGTVHALTEPGPNGHQQCRCSRMPATKSWAELGFPDLDEPAPLIPNATEFFDGLDPADQKLILGTKAYNAWAAGEFPMERWATRQKNVGWRDSYVPAKPPSVSGGRRAA